MRKPLLHTQRQPPRNSKKRARSVDTEEEEEEEDEEAGAPDAVRNETARASTLPILLPLPGWTYRRQKRRGSTKRVVVWTDSEGLWGRRKGYTVRGRIRTEAPPLPHPKRLAGISIFDLDHPRTHSLSSLSGSR